VSSSPTAQIEVYRLGSSPAVYAPGILNWAIAHYWHEPDRETLRKVITNTWSGIPDEVVDRVLKQELQVELDGETVVINVDASTLTQVDA
jgi:hypothetical protein